MILHTCGVQVEVLSLGLGHGGSYLGIYNARAPKPLSHPATKSAKHKLNEVAVKRLKLSYPSGYIVTNMASQYNSLNQKSIVQGEGLELFAACKRAGEHTCTWVEPCLTYPKTPSVRSGNPVEVS